MLSLRSQEAWRGEGFCGGFQHETMTLFEWHDAVMLLMCRRLSGYHKIAGVRWHGMGFERLVGPWVSRGCHLCR